jgi:uncharacterized protein (TIGR02186 family)
MIIDNLHNSRILHTIFFCIITLFLLPQDVRARPLIADLSLRQIEIDSGFSGTEILLFGARNDAGDIVVVVRGPELSYIVRKKERVSGIWVNKKQAIFNNINGYYNVSSNRPLAELRNDSLLADLDIGINNITLPIKTEESVDKEEFNKAFLDKQEAQELYFPIVGEVLFIGDVLFRTIIKFPENIPRGVYTAEVYLFSDGQLSGVQSTPLIVKKRGFDAFIYDFSYNHPTIYGIMSVMIALAAGWIAGIIFRKV